MSEHSELVETAFLAAVTAYGITELRSQKAYDPYEIPQQLPALTMVYIGPSPQDFETGPRVDMTHEWAILLYVDKGADAQAAQTNLKTILPKLVKAVAVEPTLGGACDKAWVDARRFRPDFNQDRVILKESRLFAVLSE